jgi:hypothetical protein
MGSDSLLMASETLPVMVDVWPEAVKEQKHARIKRRALRIKRCFVQAFRHYSAPNVQQSET